MTGDSVDALLRELDTPPEIRWRLEQLLDAGYQLEHAERLAGSRDVDLHEAVDLVTKSGCIPELAAAILL